MIPKTPEQKKFAALAEPKDKITYADKIAGATGKSKKMKQGGMARGGGAAIRGNNFKGSILMDKIKPKKKMAMGKMMGGGMSKKPMAYKKGGMSTKKDNKEDIEKVEHSIGASRSSRREVARKKMMGGGMSKKPMMMMKGGVAEAARKNKNKK